MRNLSKIPFIYKSAYMQREADYTKDEMQRYFESDDGTLGEIIALESAMQKRDDFFKMWLREYHSQHGFHADRLLEDITSASSRAVVDALFNATDEELNNAYTGLT